ncbi:MAG: energy transducer TonB [Pseudanabaena sp.]
MKNISKLADIQSKKENRALAFLLFIGFIGSACVHAVAMMAPVTTLWRTISKDDDIMEVVVDTSKTPEQKAPEIAKEPEPVVKLAVNQPSQEVAPAAIALAPETQTSLKEGKDAAAPDNLKLLLTTGTSDIKIQQGGSPIIAKDGTGSGFGNAKIPTGFVLGGKINGNPNGKKDSVVGGVVNGNPNGIGTQTSALPAPTNPPIESNEKRPPKLECLSCPKPQYRGKEGTPRVTYDIAPDGRVTNVRLRQSSGDEQTDRETLEAMSKWQFNPKTIPEGGRTDVKVRVTFEEQGSQFQRQNEDRRREAERLAEQERQQREAERSLPAPTAVTPVNNPSSTSSNNNPPPVNLPPEPSPSITTTSTVVDAPPQSAPVVNTPPAPVVDTPPPAAAVVDAPPPPPTESAPALPPPPPLPTSGK